MHPSACTACLCFLPALLIRKQHQKAARRPPFGAVSPCYSKLYEAPSVHPANVSFTWDSFLLVVSYFTPRSADICFEKAYLAPPSTIHPGFRTRKTSPDSSLNLFRR